jgi:predicted GNAT superfamily acetyltransferase
VSVYIVKWYGDYDDIGRSCWSLVDNRVLGEWELVVSSQWDEPNQADGYCGQGSALIGASEVEPDAGRGG